MLQGSTVANFKSNGAKLADIPNNGESFDLFMLNFAHAFWLGKAPSNYSTNVQGFGIKKVFAAIVSKLDYTTLFFV